MRRWTIGVLIPLLDGFYFGDIIWGISLSAKQYNVDVIVMTTTVYNSASVRIDFDFHVGWDLVDAWIVVADAVKEEYLIALSQLGKPIISVVKSYNNVGTFLVKCDNQGSTTVSTKHLIDLGHRVIAFVGVLSNPDILERFEGYKDALQQSGISFNEQLVYEYWSGEEAVQAMRVSSLGLQATAIVVATDNTAVSMVNELQQRGIRVPEDIAIVGFDDSAIARTCKPTLTTVRQPIIDLGLTAMNRVVQVLTDKLSSPDTILLPAKFIPRESSGSKQIDVSNNDQTFSWSNIQDDELEKLIDAHHQLGLNLIDSKDLSWLRWTNQHWGCLGLWDGSPTVPDSKIIIERTFSLNEDLLLPEIGTALRIEQFPTLPTMEKLLGSDVIHFAVVQPVYSDTRNWGFLVTVGPVNERLLRGYDTRQLPALVGIMNEHKVLLNDLHLREASNWALVAKLEIVSRTTNDGVYDLDLGTNEMEWIAGIENILGVEKDELPNKAEDFIAYIHPDDLPHVLKAWDEHFNMRKPFNLDIRMLRIDEYIWVTSSGEALFDKLGIPLRFIGSITNIHKRKLAEEQIQYLAYRDPLTGLANRRFFYDKLTESITTALEYDTRIAILVIDLDHFKEVNDSFGHDIGDMLLKYVAEILEKHIGSKGLVGRIGGDEFMVMVTGIQLDDELQLVTNRILTNLQQPMINSGHEVYATVSIGVSWYPDNGMDIYSLIKMADTAMYRAKRQGRNRAQTYLTSIDLGAQDRLTIANNLRKAVNNMLDFHMYYQPQLDLKTNKLIGMEALIRWFYPAECGIPPGVFIPMSEENGLIIPVGNWVLREACQQLKTWEHEATSDLIMSINISANQLLQADFVANVDQIIADTGINPEQLCFEITEIATLQNIDFSLLVLNQLLDRGIQIALDDFGIGYSSILLFKLLPLKVIKIDRSFIGELSQPHNTAIVTAIIAMSKSLDMRVIAEGVETLEQLELLRDMGCDAYQGHITSPAISAEHFEAVFLKDLLKNQ